MQLQYTSITGADDAVSPKDLVKLSQEFPFVEWAILLLPARAGTARCPSKQWIKDFSAQAKGLHTAMHLCDEALLGFIRGDKEILDLMAGFQRIQLNLKFGAVEGKYDPADLVRRVKDNPNHAVLFDESAGRGISPDSWDAPLDGHFSGYAGGLKPDNVAQNLETIAKVAKGHVTWIDMETGVRTDDKFDLAKVRRVLEISAPYAATPAPVAQPRQH